MADAQGPAIWFWVDGGGAAPASKVHRLLVLGIGVLPLMLMVVFFG